MPRSVGRAELGRRLTDANGYIRVRVAEGWVYEHRSVWQQVNGPIPEGFHVHHKNHDRTDNRIENLELRSAFDHVSEHVTERHGNGTLNNRGDRSPRYRTDLDDAEIIRRVDAGESFRSIARSLGGLSHNVVSNHYRRARSAG